MKPQDSLSLSSSEFSSWVQGLHERPDSPLTKQALTGIIDHLGAHMGHRERKDLKQVPRPYEARKRLLTIATYAPLSYKMAERIVELDPTTGSRILGWVDPSDSEYYRVIGNKAWQVVEKVGSLPDEHIKDYIQEQYPAYLSTGITAREAAQDLLSANIDILGSEAYRVRERPEEGIFSPERVEKIMQWIRAHYSSDGPESLADASFLAKRRAQGLFHQVVSDLARLAPEQILELYRISRQHDQQVKAPLLANHPAFLHYPPDKHIEIVRRALRQDDDIPPEVYQHLVQQPWFIHDIFPQWNRQHDLFDKLDGPAVGTLSLYLSEVVAKRVYQYFLKTDRSKAEIIFWEHMSTLVDILPPGEIRPMLSAEKQDLRQAAMRALGRKYDYTNRQTGGR